MNKDLTIVICTLNEEKNIRILLDLLYQKIEKYNLFVIDADSEDNTREFAKMYQEVEVFNPGKIGLLFQRIYAIKKIQTQYVAFIDADDFIEPEAILDALEYLKSNKIDGVQFKTTSRVINNNYWQKVWEAYFKTIYVDDEDIDMLGRPCITKANLYSELDIENLVVIPIILEDTYLHKLLKNKHGVLKYKVAPFYSFRLCEDNRLENWKKWYSYGNGDAVITNNIKSFYSSFYHLFFRILINRTLKTAISSNFYYTPGILFFSIGRLTGFVIGLVSKSFKLVLR